MSQPLCPEWSGRARTNTRGFTSKDQAALVGGVIGAVFLMMAAGFAAWSARPVPFDIPGNHPEQWFQGRNAEIVGMLGGECVSVVKTFGATRGVD